MRLVRSLGLCGILWLLGACQQGVPRPVLTPTPTPTLLPTTISPPPTSTPAQPELIFCVPE